MIAELIEIIESLTLIMQEETALLQSARRDRNARAAVMVGAKLRLLASLELRIAELGRQDSDWIAGLESEIRATLTAATAALCEVSIPNRAILERHIDLSTEMMGVVAAEAQRQSGARSATYGAFGGMNRTRTPSPISVNTSL